ncbi:MAG: transposase [Candidatus Saccharibacteria bacterium]|nr:transposase [Rhodoferax sp.]
MPQALVGQVLEARVTARAVEVLHRGQRVASHLRCAHKGGFTTVPEHLSAAHRTHMQWTPERLIHWGNSIGAGTGSLVTRLLATRKHPEQAYRACLGLLALAKRFTRPRLEAACVVALATTNEEHDNSNQHYNNETPLFRLTRSTAGCVALLNQVAPSFQESCSRSGFHARKLKVFFPG